MELVNFALSLFVAIVSAVSVWVNLTNRVAILQEKITSLTERIERVEEGYEKHLVKQETFQKDIYKTLTHIQTELARINENLINKRSTKTQQQ